MSSPAPSAALSQYYIADGVHRAVAARENGLARVAAKLVIQGQPDQLIYVNPNQLRSPKASISRTVTARRNYPALEAAMATPARRAMTNDQTSGDTMNSVRGPVVACSKVKTPAA